MVKMSQMTPFSQTLIGTFQDLQIQKLERADQKMSLTKKLKMKSPYMTRSQANESAKNSVQKVRAV